MSRQAHPGRRRARGVVTIEFALMMLFGVLPLLLITFTGVMIFAAQQSLALAAGEGARASLRYGSTAERRSNACQAAARSMQWLLNYSNTAAGCSSANAAPIAVSQPYACAADSSVKCIKVTTYYNHDAHPFMPGTGALMGWSMGKSLSSTAVVQLDLGDR
ncbi:pilus assembly protein TadE [Stenotrophomonas terrae]|uniref:Pilus assembly protein TadE n=1 Tax=Stenotrophomonas terrae TaxID=405446 RepID=A0A0R0CUW0_9GAMM|nr:pilus assembly protein TadE [Stenotrophomonas terrae]KRG70274.1 pilus assembly protein TadE [Stenotrophomonas terrae]